MIITLLNLKGGCGKTTLSVHIASTLALAGKKVLLIDADEQMSVINWSENRTDDPIFTIVGMPSKGIHRQLPRLDEDYDFIIIDGPPRISGVSKSCIIGADLVLIPVTPSPYDVWASGEVVEILNDVKSIVSEYKIINAAIIINRAISNTNLSREVELALQGHDVPVLKTVIHQRVSYAESVFRGSSAIEEEPYSVAGQEITRLVKEILVFTGIKEEASAA